MNPHHHNAEAAGHYLFDHSWKGDLLFAKWSFSSLYVQLKIQPDFHISLFYSKSLSKDKSIIRIPNQWSISKHPIRICVHYSRIHRVLKNRNTQGKIFFYLKECLRIRKRGRKGGGQAHEVVI